jgi:DNA-directed RNA polymerase subunit N (RpoN/RPB10)
LHIANKVLNQPDKKFSALFRFVFLKVCGILLPASPHQKLTKEVDESGNEDTEIITEFCVDKYCRRIHAFFTHLDVYIISFGHYSPGGHYG